MRLDRLLAGVCVVITLLFCAVDAHAQTVTIGAPSVLAHHQLGGYDGCAMRDGDAIIAVQREGLYWFDGATGALRRSVKLPAVGWRRLCGIAPIDTATTHGFIIVSDAVFGAIEVVVVSPTGVIKVQRTLPGGCYCNMDVVTIGETAYIVAKASPRETVDLYAVSTRTLNVRHTYRLPGVAALVRHGADAIAVLSSGDAFALRDTAVPTTLVFPPPVVPYGTYHPTDRTPVRLANGLYVRFESRGPTFRGTLRAMREDGSVVAERQFDTTLTWFDAQRTTVIPWDDGVRLLLTAEDTTTLSVVRVPISSAP